MPDSQDEVWDARALAVAVTRASWMRGPVNDAIDQAVEDAQPGAGFADPDAVSDLLTRYVPVNAALVEVPWGCNIPSSPSFQRFGVSGAPRGYGGSRFS